MSIQGFVSFCRPLDGKELETLIEKAKADNHGVFIPTHPLKKDGEIVGYFSIGHPGAVLCFAWLSTQDIGARESFHLINCVEDMVNRGGGKHVCFPVPKNSPFHKLMPEMGYKDAGDYTFFVKEV